MKIAAIQVYQVDLPLVEGRYSWSEGKYVEVFDSTVVELVTDDGRSGFGEVCPLGPFYLPAFAAGARAGIGELSGSLIGRDPTALGPINRLMDRALLGHPYVKSAIDMACWDLLGKDCGKSVCELFGGKFGGLAGCQVQRLELVDLIAQQFEPTVAIGLSGAQLLEMEAGIVASRVHDDGLVSYRLEVVEPESQRAVFDQVDAHHRHHQAPVGEALPRRRQELAGVAVLRLELQHPLRQLDRPPVVALRQRLLAPGRAAGRDIQQRQQRRDAEAVGNAGQQDGDQRDRGAPGVGLDQFEQQAHGRDRVTGI